MITAALVLSKSVCGVSDKSSVLPLISAFAAAATGCISQLMLKVVSTTASAFPATAVPLALALLGLCVSAPLHLTLLNRTLVGAAVALSPKPTQAWIAAGMYSFSYSGPKVKKLATLPFQF